MSFSYVLSLCLYTCAHASGGLILIAHQASKCLCHCVYFVCYWNDQQETMCYSAWQLIASLLWLLEFVLVSNICSCIFWPLMCPFCRRMFGFVARRTGSATENVCHLFAEMDPEQPAVAIVNFINKVMLGPQLHRWERRTKLWTAGDLREMLIWFWHVFFCFLWSVCVCLSTLLLAFVQVVQLCSAAQLFL